MEEQAVKALTGENVLDISIVNTMMPKYRERMKTAQEQMDEARAKMQAEQEKAKEATKEVKELASCAEAFDDADIERKHMIIARLIERIEVGADYNINIMFRISTSQYTGEVA